MAFALILFPITLILKEEVWEEMPRRILFSPITFIWSLLLFYFIYVAITGWRHYHIATRTVPRTYPTIPCVKGRKFSHPKRWGKHHFLSKATLGLVMAIFFLYLGFFIKIYILPDMSHLIAGVISFVPISVIYSMKSAFDFFKSVLGSRKRH